METITKGIFIYEKELEDNKTLVSFLTHEGEIINLVALGISKPNSKNRQNLEIYSQVEIEFFKSRNGNGGKMKKVTLESKNIINSKNRIILWHAISKILRSRQESWSIDIYKTLLEFINWNEFDYSWEIIFFLLKQLIEEENYEINIENCAICNSKHEIASFSLFENGLICKNDIKEQNYIMSSETIIKIIKLFKSKTWKNLELQNINFTKEEILFLKEDFINFMDQIIGIDISFINKISY